MTPLTITLWISGKLTNPMNGSHRHWSARAEWAATWRQRTRVAWLEAGRPVWPGGPAHVTLTAHVARLWDRSALGAGLKPVEDEALFLILGGVTRRGRDGRVQRVAPDGPGDGHRIEWAQVVKPQYRGVVVTVEGR